MLGCTFMVIVGYIKKRERVIAVQTGQFLLMALGNGVLGGTTGAVTTLISAIRNFLVYKGWINWPVKILISALLIGLGLAFNTNGLWGILPLIATVSYTLFMDIKSDIGLKLMLMATCIPWLCYDMYLMTYAALTFDAGFIISSCIGIYRIKKDQRACA